MDAIQDLIDGCRLVELLIVHDQRGNLTAITARRRVPLDIQGVCYLYNEGWIGSSKPSSPFKIHLQPRRRMPSEAVRRHVASPCAA